jgi:hypothetical protein
MIWTIAPVKNPRTSILSIVFGSMIKVRSRNMIAVTRPIESSCMRNLDIFIFIEENILYKMDKLPPEILQFEIVRFLDLSGLISISFTNKKLLETYQPVVEKIIFHIDPYATKITIYDLLDMVRVGNIQRVSFKIYNFLKQCIIDEIHEIYEYKRKSEIQTVFFSSIPMLAITELKTKIGRFVKESNVFVIHQNTVYRNYIPGNVDCSVFETELVDILEVMLHELSEIENDDHSSGLGEFIGGFDYHPCENIIISFEKWIHTL